MLNLVSIKKQQQEEKEVKGKVIPAAKRLEKDFGDLDLAENMKIHFVNGTDDPFNFEITILPPEGYYRDGSFVFTFFIPHSYPHDPPKVKCKTKVFHPNIDLEGNVCLNILREDWKPVLSIATIVHGLAFLFLMPNPEDPLNKEAAALMERNERQFEDQVQRSIFHGAHIDREYFPPCRR